MTSGCCAGCGLLTRVQLCLKKQTPRGVFSDTAWFLLPSKNPKQFPEAQEGPCVGSIWWPPSSGQQQVSLERSK